MRLEDRLIEERKQFDAAKVPAVSEIDRAFVVDFTWMQTWYKYVTKNGKPPGPISN